jgi:hypothetical protein
MGVESREPTNGSGSFHLKHSDTIAKQKKIHLENYRRGPSSKKNFVHEYFEKSAIRLLEKTTFNKI